MPAWEQKAGTFLTKEKIMKVLLEIRPGEGGQDARLLVQNQAAIYIRFAETHGLAVEVEDQDSL